MDRLQLHDILVDTLGSTNVYFQPPENLKLAYPCIVYSRDRALTEFADDRPYRVTAQYQVTLISQDPTLDIWEKIVQLPLCVHSRFYAGNNLNHDVFTLFA